MAGGSQGMKGKQSAPAQQWGQTDDEHVFEHAVRVEAQGCQMGRESTGGQIDVQLTPAHEVGDELVTVQEISQPPLFSNDRVTAWNWQRLHHALHRHFQIGRLLDGGKWLVDACDTAQDIIVRAGEMYRDVVQQNGEVHGPLSIFREYKPANR